MKLGPRTTGIALIAVERDEQTTREGYTPAHDDTHTDCAMVGAAINYAAMGEFITHFKRTDGAQFFHGLPPELKYWPGDWTWKPSYDDPIRNLVKAGALIAAEIDRLLRAKEAARLEPSVFYECQGCKYRTVSTNDHDKGVTLCPRCEVLMLLVGE